MRQNASTLVVALGVGLSLCACSRFDRDEQAVQLVEKMADIFDKDQSDCDRLASDLNTFVKENDGTFRKINEAKSKETPEQKKQFEQKYEGRLDAAARKMMGGLAKCATNARVQEAVKNLPR